MDLGVIELGRSVLWTVPAEDFAVDPAPLAEYLLTQPLPRNPEYPHQTQAILQTLTAAPWPGFTERLMRAFSTVLGEVLTPPASATRIRLAIEAWASFDDPAATGTPLSAGTGMHNHLPALLSAVYFVSLPDELVEARTAGTVFVNSLHDPIFNPRATVTVHPSEGDIVIFPGGLLHAPAAPSRTSGSRARIVIAANGFLDRASAHDA